MSVPLSQPGPSSPEPLPTTLPRELAPIPNSDSLPSSQQLLDKGVNLGIVKYGASGAKGHNGEPQLTKEGHEIKRVISGTHT